MFNTLPANPFPPSSEQMGAGGGSYDLPVASADTLGGVKVGTGLSINESGVLSNSNPTPYSLPTASDETLGGVKVGSNLSIEDGVLSAPAPYTPLSYSTTEQNTGVKWIDGKDIYQRVYQLESPLTLSVNTWTATGFSGAGIGTIINAFGGDSLGTFFNFFATKNASNTGEIGLFQTRNDVVIINFFVLSYTKATT